MKGFLTEAFVVPQLEDTEDPRQGRCLSTDTGWRNGYLEVLGLWVYDLASTYTTEMTLLAKSKGECGKMTSTMESECLDCSCSLEQNMGTGDLCLLFAPMTSGCYVQGTAPL